MADKQKLSRLMDETFRILTTTPDGLLTTSCLAGLRLKELASPRRMAVCTQSRTVFVNTEWLDKLPVTQRAYVFAHGIRPRSSGPLQVVGDACT
jgi:hypothetical protein